MLVHRYALSMLAAALFSMTGCVPLPGLDQIGAYSNVKLQAAKNGTNAAVSPIPNNDYFIGLALSGGGSRAANFSANIMLELDRLGMLEHVQYISSVSGGSLPAAYYTLFKNDRERWKETVVRETMAQCFECWGLAYLFNPLRFLKFLGTSYDRTDVMAEVFDNRVYDHRTFAQIDRNGPRPIINSTRYIDGYPFIFTNGTFDELQSDLGNLRIAEAVMASAAYPGGFRNVTLKDFNNSNAEQTEYVHLFDAGVNDNLGIDSLLAIHRKHVELQGAAAFQGGCLIILVDSYTPYLEKEAETRPDTRTLKDLIIDTNFLNASSIFLQTKRRRTIESLGFDESNRKDAVEEAKKAPNARRPISFLSHLKSEHVTQLPNETPAEFAKREMVQRKRSECRIWHIALTQLGLREVRAPINFSALPEFYEPLYMKNDPVGTPSYYERLNKLPYSEFTKSLRAIPTRFSICEEDARFLQVAAELLVREENSGRLICQWLKQISGQDCRAVGP